MAKKVLIIYAGAGQGHFSSAKSIKQALAEKYPALEAGLFDVLSHPYQIYQKAFVNGYDYLSAKAPIFWRLLYRFFTTKRRQISAELIFKLFFEKRLVALIGNFKPDFIMATHFLPLRLLSLSKERDLIDIPSGVVMTDYGCHSFWLDEEINYYFVATENLKKCLQGCKIKTEQIIVSGIPIEKKFSSAFDKPALMKKFGLRPELFTLLIVGGQFSFGEMKSAIDELNRSLSGKIQFLIVAGRDYNLKKEVDQSDLDQAKNIKTFGFIDNLEELMAVADVIFSKAGGLTVSECLALGLPMIINKVIPGQEEDNAEFLTGQGAGFKVNDFKEIKPLIADLIANPQKLAAAKKACQDLGKPRAAETLVDFVYQRIISL